MSPLALMDSSAWLFASSFARARIGADRYSGFKAFFVGSHDVRPEDRIEFSESETDWRACQK
jgi:hypothetical protein